ncbi:MAG: hypothetical protein GX764_04345 [Firmicutes bacterium]|nr:hypothetical protein [Bacillota bacterium]
MPFLIPRQSNNKGLTTILIVLNCCLLLIFIVLILSPPKAASAPVLLQDVLEAMQQETEYSLTIQEKSDQYTLLFQGEYLEGQLYGTLSEYDLQLYRKKGTLYVKESESKDWQMASELELEGLNIFLYTPLEILELLNLNQARFGPDDSVNGKTLKTIYLPLESQLLPRFFPADNEMIIFNGKEEAELFLWVDLEELFLSRMAMVISLETPSHGEVQITRAFMIEPGRKRYPAGTL